MVISSTGTARSPRGDPGPIRAGGRPALLSSGYHRRAALSCSGASASARRSTNARQNPIPLSVKSAAGQRV